MSAPVADFSFAPKHGPAQLSVQFTDKSTNSPTSWKWTLDPGDSRPPIVSTEQNPQVSLNVGRWAAMLEATNADGVGTKSVPNGQGPHVTAPA